MVLYRKFQFYYITKKLIASKKRVWPFKNPYSWTFI